jgi:sugar phosphate isomerase/epimerase
MKLEFMASLGYAAMSPEAVCESLAKRGYDAVGWTRAHFDTDRKSRAELAALIELPKRFGLQTGELVIQQDMVTLDDALQQKRIEIVLRAIEAAAEVEAPPPINLFSGPASWEPGALLVGRDIDYSTAWDRILSAYEPLVRRAEALGVDLAVEGVWGMVCHNFFTTNHLIETFDSPRLGVNYDPSHDVLVGIEDAGWVIRQWAKKGRIKHVHLKDAVGTSEGGRFLFPLLGEGRVPWPSFFETLREVGFDGCMSVEFESFKYYETVLGRRCAFDGTDPRAFRPAAAGEAFAIAATGLQRDARAATARASPFLQRCAPERGDRAAMPGGSAALSGTGQDRKGSERHPARNSGRSDRRRSRRTRQCRMPAGETARWLPSPRKLPAGCAARGTGRPH